MGVDVLRETADATGQWLQNLLALLPVLRSLTEKVALGCNSCMATNLGVAASLLDPYLCKAFTLSASCGQWPHTLLAVLLHWRSEHRPPCSRHQAQTLWAGLLQCSLPMQCASLAAAPHG